MRKGSSPGVAAGEPDAMAARDLHRDLGARVAGADNQHAALAQLRRVAVVARMQLDDRRVELARKRGERGS